MHRQTLQNWQHDHTFDTADRRNERRTLQVVALTGAMMVVEIAAGWLFGSMALLADGWHMGTHAAALGIALFAYVYARRQARNPRFSFGTGKVSVLGGYTSAIVLLIVAILMAVESVQRLFAPQIIRFDQALLVAGLGLAVNLFSAFLLQGGHDHDHDHGSDHTHGVFNSQSHNDTQSPATPAGHSHHPDHHDQDYNLRAAYLHVLADALTSLLAIAALLAGRAFGWVWMDAIMGIVGAIVITRWSVGLLRESGQVLLDSNPPTGLAAAVREAIEADADNLVSDLHIWSIGQGCYAAVLAIVTHFPQPVEHYKGLLHGFNALVHISVEVNVATSAHCMEPVRS